MPGGMMGGRLASPVSSSAPRGLSAHRRAGRAAVAFRRLPDRRETTRRPLDACRDDLIHSATRLDESRGRWPYSGPLDRIPETGRDPRPSLRILTTSVDLTRRAGPCVER